VIEQEIGPETEQDDTQKAVIPGVAHVPNMERPELFSRLVLDFLDAHLTNLSQTHADNF